MYFLIGLSTILSPAILLLGGSSRKAMGWLAIVFLLIAAGIAIFIGANAAFGHVAGWSRWTPWYGAVNVSS
jgi:putative membrane protein